MTYGGWWLRIATTGLFASGVALLVTFSPSSMQTVANGLFYFESNADERVYSLAGLILSIALLVSFLAERSIGGAAAAKATL